MLYSTPNTREVSWGNWGLTFLDRNEIVAKVDFPCGAQGPVDGTIGSPERKGWLAVVEAWREHAMLPNGVYFPRGLRRGSYSLQFQLEVR